MWWFNDLTEVFFYEQTGTSSLLPWSPSPEGRWIQYVYNNALWWQNDVTKKFFFESTGTRNVPVKALGNCCISTAGDADATTAGDDAATLDAFTNINDGDTLNINDGALPSSVTLGRPGLGYTGQCTHRTYAQNLYKPGQLPPTDEVVEC